MRFTYSLAIAVMYALMSFGCTATAQNKQFTFEDVMKFNHLEDPEISRYGDRVAYSLQKDRGDGKVVITSLENDAEWEVERGFNPSITRDGLWVASYIEPPAEKKYNPYLNDDEVPPQGMALVNAENGEKQEYEDVIRFSFSNDSRWVIYQKGEQPDVDDQTSRSDYGSQIFLHELGTDSYEEIDFVKDFSVDSTSTWLVYSVADTSGEENGLYAQNLEDGGDPLTIHEGPDNRYTGLTWHNSSKQLGFLESGVDAEHEETGPATLRVWDGENQDLTVLADSDDAPAGWLIPSHANLTWNDDGDRLFFGYQPEEMFRLARTEEEDKDPDDFDLYDFDTILDEKGLDVWHWEDPKIKTHEKQTWENRRDHTYLAVHHLDQNETVALADEEMRNVQVSEKSDFALGFDDQPYRQLRTWDGTYYDYFVVDLRDGSRERVVDKIRGFNAQISPGGKYVAFYEYPHWHLYSVEEGTIINLTDELEHPFYNELHDRIEPAPSYGVAGWTEDDESLLIYDRFDIWQFDTNGGHPQKITGGYGRENDIQLRIEDLDPETEYFSGGETLFLSAFNERNKQYGFYEGSVGGNSVSQHVKGEYRYTFIDKAPGTDRILYSRENFNEYPDLWVADTELDGSRQISEANPQVEDFAWGEAELVEWKSVDGKPHQGVLIYPGDYDPDETYPVFIYYYERYSQRLHHFDEQVLNHRPNIPQYTSDGYAFFMPDVWYTDGQPGYSATKSIVPGVHKLIEKGVADPDAIGIHGHSWSGYKTANIITETDIFAAALAGAPVSNMTSAYSGIRWGTGLARQFQYEQTQSRLGGSLWEKRELYIENSPVFQADRINTPLLQWFGDEDGAVPWEQGIELALALRRLDKDSWFLQYRGEPHHLQQYPNMVDFSIKMKEFFDHYLKGESMPEWMEEGQPYLGD